MTELPLLSTDSMNELTRHHFENCAPYKAILTSRAYNPNTLYSLSELPFLPVPLFKDLDLRSVPESQVYKTLLSSGTSGQRPSKIFLNQSTASKQSLALTKIVNQYIGNKRLPMLVIDSKMVLEDRTQFSARGAGILGFSIFGQGQSYALDRDYCLDLKVIEEFLGKHGSQNFLIFGFTALIWQHLVEELNKSSAKFDFSQGILIHGGGWKKLADRALSPSAFKEALFESCGLNRVHNYYGMVEQTGSIFMECEEGYFHASPYSELFTRDSGLKTCELGQEGLLQLLSILPESYPGHNLLTEDLGTLWGENNCRCKRAGKYFSVKGRAPKAELRGCSDVR